MAGRMSYVIDEQKHPGSKSFERRHRDDKVLPGCSQFFNFAAVDSFDQGVACGKVTVKRAWADVRAAGDVVKRSL